MSAFRIAVLASGDGTNLQAILDQLHGQDGIEVVAVGSDKPDARRWSGPRGPGSRPASSRPPTTRTGVARDAAIADWLEERGVDLVVLAGYMQLLSAEFIARFPNRIVNVHPALLPSFPGLDAIGQALEHGVRVTGVTVHFVDEGVDSGPIILQRPVPVPPSRDRDELEEAIHADRARAAARGDPADRGGPGERRRGQPAPGAHRPRRIDSRLRDRAFPPPRAFPSPPARRCPSAGR